MHEHAITIKWNKRHHGGTQVAMETIVGASHAIGFSVLPTVKVRTIEWLAFSQAKSQGVHDLEYLLSKLCICRYNTCLGLSLCPWDGRVVPVQRVPGGGQSCPGGQL